MPSGRRLDRALTRASGLAVLLALAMLFWPVAARRMFVYGDLGNFFLPIRLFLFESLQRGEAPLWLPQLFCGFYVHGEAVRAAHLLRRSIRSDRGRVLLRRGRAARAGLGAGALEGAGCVARARCRRAGIVRAGADRRARESHRVLSVDPCHPGDGSAARPGALHRDPHLRGRADRRDRVRGPAARRAEPDTAAAPVRLARPFAPQSYQVGKWISLAGAAWIAAVALHGLRARGRDRRAQPPPTLGAIDTSIDL